MKTILSHLFSKSLSTSGRNFMKPLIQHKGFFMHALKAFVLSMLLTPFSAYAAGVLITNARISNAISNTSTMGLALDGDVNTTWNSGDYPQPTWIDIDLQKEQVVDSISLDPAQLPNGYTAHNIYGRTEAGEWIYFGTISQYTSDGQWFSQAYPDQNTPVRYVIVQTTDSAGSWVAWREFKVFARQNTTPPVTPLPPTTSSVCGIWRSKFLP